MNKSRVHLVQQIVPETEISRARLDHDAKLAPEIVFAVVRLEPLLHRQRLVGAPLTLTLRCRLGEVRVESVGDTPRLVVPDRVQVQGAQVRHDLRREILAARNLVLALTCHKIFSIVNIVCVHTGPAPLPDPLHFHQRAVIPTSR